MKRCQWGEADVQVVDGPRVNAVTTCPAEAVALVWDLHGVGFYLCQDHIDYLNAKGVDVIDEPPPEGFSPR